MSQMSSKPDRGWLRDNPEYIDLLKDLIEYEESLSPEDDDMVIERYNEENSTDYEVKWRNTDTGVDPSRLYHIEKRGFLERVFDSNSTTMYTLAGRGEIEDMISEIDNQFKDGRRTVLHDFPDEDKLEEMGIFDDVVGYEDVKFLMRRAMSNEDIVNVVMFGPPGSAKTVFLMCINKLDDSCFISGKPTTGPGFYDKMFEEEPRYMAIDEMDNMSTDDQKALSDYTEHGILVETKGNDQRREMRTNTKTFAAANRPDDILEEIQNRFIDLHFDPYTYDEFIEVCEHILPRNEDKSASEATEIAEAVWEFEGFGNVRKAIQTARLSRGDPEKVIGVLNEYSGGPDDLLS